MGTLTSRTKQTKPAGTDQVDIAVLNGDLDIGDSELGAPVVAISSPLPTVPYDGQLRYDKNDGFIKVYDAALTQWVLFAPNMKNLLQSAGGGWITTTPTIQNITLGTGSPKNLFEYVRLPGNLIFWKWNLILGTAGAVTGLIAVTLPAAIPSDQGANINAYVANDAVGVGECNLTSNASRHALTALLLNPISTPGTIFFIVGDTGANVTTAVPIAWAAGSSLNAHGIYRTSA